MANELTFQALSEAAFVNPSLSKAVAPDEVVSFIPMADVSDTGQWTGRQTRKQREVAVGYTPFEERDVLFAKITPCMENGKGCHALGLVNGIGYGSTEFHVLRAKPGTNDRFLYFWLVTDEVRKKAEAFMIGSAGQQRVQKSFFDHFRIPRLDEDVQAFAAHILDAADEAIVKTDELITKLKAIKQGLLHDLLTRGLDDNGELREPEKHPEHFKDSLLRKIPIDWAVEPLQVAAQKIQDGTHFSPKSTSGTFRYMTSKNVRFGRIDLIDCGWISEKEHRSIYSRCDIKFGDILLTKDGANTGNAAIYDLHEEVSLLSSVAFIRCNTNKLVSGYLLQYLLSPIGQRRIKDLMAGVGITRLTVAKIREFLIPLPMPNEQTEIANRLKTCDIRLSAEESCLSKLKSIKKGLMQDLLTGRVRVSKKILKKEWT
jgi:type I restriction enzyme S subunit